MYEDGEFVVRKGTPTSDPAVIKQSLLLYLDGVGLGPADKRLRMAVDKARELRMELGRPSDSEANRIVIEKRVYQWVKDKHPDMRSRDLALVVQVTSALTLMPCVEETVHAVYKAVASRERRNF